MDNFEQEKIKPPILTIDELPQRLIEQPANIALTELYRSYNWLSPHENVVHIEDVSMQHPSRPASAVRELLRLCQVDHASYIGTRGPAVASLSTEENADIEALRKYEVVHGRDALRIALDLHEHYPALLPATIIDLAKTQGLKHETYMPGTPFRQEEPGRIILLNRAADDPIGVKFSERLGWGFPFYGSIDATPQFISAIATHSRKEPAFLQSQYTALDQQERTIIDSLRLSVEWLENRMSQNPEGLLEFKNGAQKGGMASQAWKDSAKAYVHADGSLANHDAGIASIEVQGLAYDALIDAAETLESHCNDTETANRLRSKAEQLRGAVLEKFWVDDPNGGYFALATDRDEKGSLRQVQVRSSNMGHLLQTRILDNIDGETIAKRYGVIETITSDDMLAPYGVRTLARSEKGYNPGGYHTGLIWMWDTKQIVNGLYKHGYTDIAEDIESRLFKIVEETNCFPEHVRGDSVDRVELNNSEIYVYDSHRDILHLVEQPPQLIQGWSVSAILASKRNHNPFR